LYSFLRFSINILASINVVNDQPIVPSIDNASDGAGMDAECLVTVLAWGGNIVHFHLWALCPGYARSASSRTSWYL